MTIYALSNSSPALPQFSAAAALANNVRDRVLGYLDASWSNTELATILPSLISNTGSDSTTLLTNTSALYTSAGAVSNGGTYTLMKDGLDRLLQDLSFGRNITTPVGPTARIVFTDSTGSVAYDSAKTNTIGGALLATNVTSPALINNNHFNRIEFAEAEKAPSGVTINRRFSSTLRQMEDRAVFALTRPGTSSVVGMIAISRSAV